MWAVYAFAGAVFAALTSILGKIGVSGINSNLGTAIRTIFVLICAWAMVFITKSYTPIREIQGKTMLFLILSGFATGFSWLFFYKALQIGPVAKVVSIDKLSMVLTFILAAVVLKEALTWKTVLGSLLMVAGTFVIAFL